MKYLLRTLVVLLAIPVLIICFGVIVIAILLDIISIPLVFIIKGEWDSAGIFDWFFVEFQTIREYLRERELL